MELWHSYVNWEKGNPLKVDLHRTCAMSTTCAITGTCSAHQSPAPQVEDPALVARRVMFAYEQSLLCLGHHPDIWSVTRLKQIRS